MHPETQVNSDVVIQRDAIDELVWEPQVDPATIGVTVDDGLVTLVGHVRSLAEKWAAEQAIKRVAGVRAVVNMVEVDLGTAARSDADIARAALGALEWDVAIPDKSVTVVVSDGWVTLEGEVEWQYQKVSAEHAVGHLAGVKGVTNLLKVMPVAAAGDVAMLIEQALERRAALNEEHITVETSGHTVKLSGTVRTWAEWEAAEQAAWSAPGVADVENRVLVIG